jgi:hypothetical protein
VSFFTAVCYFVEDSRANGKLGWKWLMMKAYIDGVVALGLFSSVAEIARRVAERGSEPKAEELVVEEKAG